MIKRTIPELLGSRPIPSVRPDIAVSEACAVLTDLDIGAAVVMEGDRLVGILSERDVIRKCICRGRLTAETKVAEIMTAELKTVSIDDPVATALAVMLDGGFRHVPVMQNGRIAGLLSMRDIPAENRVLVERFREYTEVRAAGHTEDA
ncbi:CBS domain-containing protein [Pseudoruegeria sp. HB172150]|uniref:CBS domain-containing protein n=1 Tax=Pseudoruegeria sp. HB172150 TaxID=2721164 RepID=UPI0015550B12|nr:CBS domain-containing protein [Pseudoruegeria sp. HB172150]